jgi:hypothetical protein
MALKIRGAASFGSNACALGSSERLMELSQLHMSSSRDHGAVKGVSCGKILCMFQSQLKLTGLKGNARGGQIGQNGGRQHTTDCRKSGHDAEAAQDRKRHDIA